jgi:hypothetical protein
VIACGEIKPTEEAVAFMRGDPAVLTDILSQCFLSDYRKYLLFEVSVGAVV